MRRNGRPKRRARSYALEDVMPRQARAVPVEARPALAAWLDRYRRHRMRAFWQLDPVTGQWRRV